MKVLFRTDSSLQIGSGHVMRCLTLAEALRAEGADCRFVCRDHPGHLAGLIAEHGFPVSLLPAGSLSSTAINPKDGTRAFYSEWLGADTLTDAGQTLAAVDEDHFDWLVVDHYALGIRWESTLRKVCTRLMVIDDLADRRHDCNLLLDQNLGRDAKDYAKLAPKTCVFLVGPKYALLRPEFAALREYSFNRRKDASLQVLLVSMGGFDPQNVTGRILATLARCSPPVGCRVVVVMGLSAPYLDRVREAAGEMPWPCDVRVNVRDMAQLMADSDLAIGAAGSTSWERCCLGLPSIIIPLADNQVEAGRALQSESAVILVERTSLDDKLPMALACLESSMDLAGISAKATKIVDGMGTGRVVRALAGRD